MKKTVLAFAVAAAMGVPAVAAADTTLYGRFNVSLDAVDNGATSQTMLTNNGSRIGVRGSEDLGGGLRGVFQMEAGFAGGEPAADRAFNGGSLASRNTFVGLAGDFGEVRLGKHDTPYKLSTLRLNVFADTLGDMHNIFGAGPGINAADAFYDRRDNTIVYMSPNFEGFQGMVSYTTDADSDYVGNDEAGDNSIVSLAGTYTNGPLFVALAYQKIDFVDDDDVKDDASAWKIGGTYTIDDLTLAAAFEQLDLVEKRNAYHIGARYNMGQTYLMASYTQANAWIDGVDDGAKMFAVGAGYNFSRRTGVYAVYAQIENGENAFLDEDINVSYGLVGTGSGKGFRPADGEDTAKGFQIGVWHNF